MQKGMVSFITHTVYSNHFRGLLQGVLCGDFCGLLRGDLRGVDKLVSALLFIPLGDSLQNGKLVKLHSSDPC